MTLPPTMTRCACATPVWSSCGNTPRHLRGSSAAQLRTCQACRSAQDDGLEPPQEEQRFLDVLAKLKTRDGALYASSGPLFPDASGSGDDAGERPAPSAKRQKVLTLATVNAQQARFPSSRSSVSAKLACEGKGSAVALAGAGTWVSWKAC